MKKKLAVLNLISVISVISINYLSQMLTFNNKTIGEVSEMYSNLFTPASYAFSIWGLIFLSLLTYSIYQIKVAFFSDDSAEFINQTGFWFAISNVLNCLWLFAFIHDYIGLSVLIMFGILFSLIKVILNTNMERWDAPLKIIAFVWWPICLYAGWINVATIANVSTYLTKLNWDGAVLSPEIWTLIMVIVAGIINIMVIFKRNMREFAMVGVWALVAIFIRHQNNYDSIAYTALIIAIIIVALSGWHGYQNRATNPFRKLKNN